MATKKKTTKRSAPRRAPKPGGAGIKLNTERERVNRQGYDSRGKYWGVGEKLWRVIVVDKSTDIYVDTHVRAPNAREAKNRVIAGMMKSLSLDPDQHAAVARKQLSRPAFSGPSLGPSTVSPHRGERSFAEQPSGDDGESFACPNGHGGHDLYFNNADKRLHCSRCGAKAVPAR